MHKLQTEDQRPQTMDQNFPKKNLKEFTRRNFSLCDVFSPCSLAGKVRFLVLSLICCLVFWSFPIPGFCDILRLKEVSEGEKGAEVEILEETQDSFIIKVPKEEIEVIKRKRPTDIKLWKEKRILWEDTEDYITIYLPKEKIVLPEDYKGEEYDSAQALKQELKYTGEEGRPEEATFWKGTGRIIGRILKGGQPLAGAKIKIVSIPSQANTLLNVFASTDKQSEELVFEAVADESGQFAFTNIPLGEYDLYWSVSGDGGWYRRLSEKPAVTVRPGETVTYPVIEIK